jgi:hypothetical protein
MRGGDVFHADTINTASGAARQRFCDAVARLAGVSADELFQRWNSEITQKADDADREAEQAARNAATETDTDPLAESREALAKMPAEIVAEAEAMLESKDLLYLVLDDIAAVGVAGERPLALTLYLVGTSRLLDRPLAAIVQGPSASGKSYIASKVADLFPEEALLRTTDLTANALYYMPQGSLRHRFVVAGERKRNEEDEAADATRALREMLAGGKLSKLVPFKQGNGAMKTEHIQQDGPIAYVETTSLMKVFEEDANRCLLLTTDERPEQTREIVAMVAARYAGARLADEGRIVARHHALQRLLDRRPVVVPYAPRLGELIDTRRVEVRRVFPHVLGLVQAAALLHQRQRPTTADGAILATEDDYQLARYLLAGPMARQLADKVSDGALRFLDRLLDWFGPGREFTKPEAHKREGGSQSTVYGWIGELVRNHVIELVEEHRGAIAAKYRLPTKPPTEGMNPLPEPEDVFPVA